MTDKYYALFYDGKQISKAHPHEAAVRVEAYERKIIITGHLGKKGEHIDVLPKDYEIREISELELLETIAEKLVIEAEGKWSYIKKIRNPRAKDYDGGFAYNFWIVEARKLMAEGK